MAHYAATETEHHTWEDEDNDGWQAVCQCGWCGEWHRGEWYQNTPDPMDAAFERAALDSKLHMMDVERKRQRDEPDEDDACRCGHPECGSC